MSSLLITNGRLICPDQNLDRVSNLLVKDGHIQAIDVPVNTPADHTIDATDQIVSPGLIDIHVHFREPGDEEKETIATGSLAAVAGGFTSVCCMPNTKPALDNEAQIEFVHRQAKQAGLARVFPVGAITKAREGKELAEIVSMHNRGAIAFSDDGVGVADASVMRKALQYTKMIDGLIMQHCEEPTLAHGAMHAGVVSTRLGLPGIPAEAEQLMIARDILLNRTIGCRYHVQHISTAFSVELVRRAKRDGLSITTEVAAHHLLLTDEACSTYDTHFKMNPPLRTQNDIDACIAGIKDGTIDCLATDHAPHRAEEKELEFTAAPMGIISLECALALYVKALVTPGHITWPQLIDLMTRKPARIARLHESPHSLGSLRPGSTADITLINPTHNWTLTPDQLKSKSKNCPFLGYDLTGRATTTIVGGKVVWKLPPLL